MPATFSWLVEDRIIYSRFSGVITLSEMEEVATLGIELVNGVSSDIPLVHAIVDNRDVTEFPQSMYKINSILSDFMKQERLGWILYVSDMNPILKMMSSLVAQVSRTRYRSFDNIQGTIEFLAYVDTSLPDMTKIDLSQLPKIHEINMPSP